MNVQDTAMDPTRRPEDDLPLVESVKLGHRFFTRWRLGMLAVLLVSVLAYLPALRGQKVWDDHLLLSGVGIGGGESVVDALLKPFLNAYFRPLVSLSFFYENQLWNGNPFLYHQTNILIHAATTALIVGLLLAALGSRKIALLGGLLFAVQPAQVATVAWIGGRTDSMCSLFVAAFAYGLIRAIQSQQRKRTFWVALSALMFFGALLTKEPILALLPVVPLGVWAFARHEERSSRVVHLKFLAPYFLASLMFVGLWLALYPNPFKPLMRTLGEQLQTAGHSTSYYTLLLLLPNGKWMHTLSLGNFEATGDLSWLAGLAVLSFAVVAAWLLIRKDPKIGWFVALALLAILPVDNLVPLPSLVVAPYRAGVAGIGVAAALAVWLLRGAPLGPARNVVIAAYCGWCAFLTWWGAAQWIDPVAIFRRISANDPTSTIARRNLSFAILRAPGDQVANAKEAISHMEGSLTLMYGSEDWRNPQMAASLLETDEDLKRRVMTNQGNHVEVWALVGELFAQLGFARAKAMDFEGSRRAFETTVQIFPGNFPARVGLAQYAIHEGDLPTAARNLRIAFAAWPKEPSVPAMLGQVYLDMGSTKNAIQSLRQSIEMKPWFGPTYLILADAQLKAGDREGALATLRESTHCRVQDAEGLQRRLAALGATAEHAH